MGRERGEGAEGGRDEASWQRSVTGVCGPSTAICHIPPRERRASRRWHSGHMVLTRGLPYQVCSVSVDDVGLAHLARFAKIELIDGHLLSPGKCSGLPDLLVVGWAQQGCTPAFCFFARLYTPALSNTHCCRVPDSSPLPKSDTKPHNKSSVAFF